MAELSPKQYAALTAMGIPVWLEKMNNIAQAAPVQTENVGLPLQGNSAAGIMLIGEDLSLDNNAPGGRLLSAMLSATDLSLNDIAILTWQDAHFPLLQAHIEANNIAHILFLGAQASDACSELILSNTVINISHHPDTLLKEPAKKAAVWQSLKQLQSA